MKNTLIVVADLGVFRAYMVEANDLESTPRLEPVGESGTVKAKNQAGVITAMEGWPAKTGINPQSPSIGSDGQQPNMKLEKRGRLITQRAQALERLLAPAEIEHCFFAAPVGIHSEVLSELSPGARSKITKALRLDLAKVPKGELLNRFAGGRMAGKEKIAAQSASRGKKSSINRSNNTPVMPGRNARLRSDRNRGGDLSRAAAGLIEISIRRGSSRKDRKLIARPAQKQSGEIPPVKRQRGEPAPVGGFAGKEAAHWSAYRENLSNVKRKPEARHPSAAKQELRKAARRGA